MWHAWIAHWTVARASLTMSRRRSTHDERTQGRKCARTFFGAHMSPFGASSARIRIVASLTMSRRRSTHNERTQGRKRARTFFGVHVSPFGASSARIRIVARVTSARIKEPSMASELHTKSSIPNTYQ